MRVLPLAEGSSGSAEPVQEVAAGMHATGLRAPSLGARRPSLSRAAQAGERR